MTDPRLHPRVRAVDGDAITYSCGCVNAITPPSGVLRSVSKCRKHLAGRRDPATLDEAYYRELGVLTADGKLAETNHVAELTEALGEFPRVEGRADALEIGCGASPYVAAIRAAGYRYTGADPSRWVADWMREHHGATSLVARFEQLDPAVFEGEFTLILAAHSLEHLEDAPGSIVSLAEMLAPGGELWIVVPDDEDPLNSDHLWFFAPDSIRSCLDAAGLAVERLEVRRRIERESFIYARARRP